MSANDRLELLNIINGIDTNNLTVQVGVDDLNVKILVALDLIDSIKCALLATTGSDTGAAAQLKLLGEISTILNFGKGRVKWFYGRLPTLYGGLEVWKSREYKVDIFFKADPDDKYQIAARIALVKDWIERAATKELKLVLDDIGNAEAGGGALKRLPGVKQNLLRLNHEANAEETKKLAEIWLEMPNWMMADDLVAWLSGR